MSPSQKIDIRQSQGLVMTTQLQQAIKLLQMNNIELSQFVQKELLENPILEEAAHEVTHENVSEKKQELSLKDISPSEQNITHEEYDNTFHDSIADKMNAPLNEASSDFKTVKDFSQAGKHEIIEQDRNIAFAHQVTLQEHLLQQLNITFTDPYDILVGSYLIGDLNEAGYLTHSPQTIAANLLIPVNKVEDIRKKCITFDPIGAFATNLKECLIFQLVEKKQYDNKMAILLDHLELLGNKDYKKILNILDVDKKTLAEMIKNIQALNPKPAKDFHHDNVQTLIPDILIEQKEDGGWSLELNSETLPNVTLNKVYKKHLSKDGIETDHYIKENVSRAKWLMKSLDQRADTILRVSSEILRQQDGFFAYGISHMKPMNLKQVAEELDLHESTISRVTSGKYMRCPRGIFELKFFFMSGLSNIGGDESISSEYVKHEIKKLVEAETTKTILSDEKIVALLAQKDIHIARRTVTKYREMLNIPSSVQRRREKKNIL